MRKKRLFPFFLVTSIAVLLLAGAAFSADSPNWGNVTGNTDIVPVRFLSDSDCYSIGTKKNLEFTVEPGDFSWGPPRTGYTFDAMIIRTTTDSRDLAGTAWYSGGGDEINLVFESGETSGDFSGSFDIASPGLVSGQSCDASFSWDFAENERFMDGVLHAPSYGSPILIGDTASCDVGVALLGDSDNPVFDILVGDSLNMEHARSYGPVDSLSQDIDLGLVFIEEPNQINVVFANFWNQQVFLEEGQSFGKGNTYFAPDLYDDGKPLRVRVDSYLTIDPALAHEISISAKKNSSFDIQFTNGEITSLSWLRCELIFQDDHGPNAAGFAGRPTSADFNDELDEKVDLVLSSDVFSGAEVTSEDFIFLTEKPISFDYIGQVSMDITVPLMDPEQPKWAVPIGLRIGIPGENIEGYDPGLMEDIDAELGENPTEGELEAAARKFLSFTKVWDSGDSFEIRLDDPEFADAVDIFFEMGDEDGDVNNIIFTLSLLVVNGGDAGSVDSATALGRKYIVIYDGVQDQHIADPIKLVAASEKSSDKATGNGGGGGCSAFGLVPAAGLLLLPLFMLLRK